MFPSHHNMEVSIDSGTDANNATNSKDQHDAAMADANPDGGYNDRDIDLEKQQPADSKTTSQPSADEKAWRVHHVIIPASTGTVLLCIIKISL